MKRVGTGGNDTLNGGRGDDELYGQNGNDMLVGKAGDDDLFGEGGNDTLFGGGGHDKLIGGRGEDSLAGGTGNDTLNGGTGNDTLEGGDGIDRAIFSGARSDYTITRIDETRVLVTDNRTNGDGADTLTLDIEKIRFTDGLFDLADLAPAWNPVLIGTEDADYIPGTEGDDTILGLGESDYLAGFAGDDNIAGGGGSDAIYGGDGLDTVVFNGNRSDYDVQLADGISVLITDLRAGSPDGSDYVTEVENFRFADGTFDWQALTRDFGMYIEGTENAEIIDAGGGDDQIYALGGDDTVISGSGTDIIAAGEGTDTVVFSGNHTHYDVTVDWSGALLVTDLRAGSPDGTDTVLDVEHFQFADGTFDLATLLAGGKEHTGTDGSDSIRGGVGSDTINGLAGSDFIEGGDGDDVIAGGADSDEIHGGNGDDTAVFTGNSTEYRVTADVMIDGRSYLSVQDARASGTDGTDYLVGVENLRFADGTFTVRDVGTYFIGTSQDELFDVGGGNDTVEAGNGNDTLIGGAGADWLLGGGGDDLLIADAHDTFLLGGTGFDTLRFDTTERVALDLANNDIEQVLSGSGGGVIYGAGSTVALTLVGGDGQDNLTGSSFDDVISSGRDGEGPYDVIDGWDGNDTLVLSGNRSDYDVTKIDWNTVVVRDLRDDASDGTDIVANVESFRFADGTLSFDDATIIPGRHVVGTADGEFLEAGYGDDTIEGLGGDDRLMAYGGDDTLDGGDGNDTLTGGEGSDQLIGGAGNDELISDGYDVLSGGDGYDTLRFDTSSYIDAVIAYAGIEEIHATEQGGTFDAAQSDVAVTFVGSAGWNYFVGSSFDDVMIAGELMQGGAGYDTFKFDQTFAGGQITDFETGIDKIDLSALGVTFADLQFTENTDLGLTYVEIPNAGFLALNNVTPSALAESDFIF